MRKDEEQKRIQNEKKFEYWEALQNGGRWYYYTVQGRHGWRARYVKEVYADEKTEKFYQEIYNEQNRLVEIHLKYPIDAGHQKVTDKEKR